MPKDIADIIVASKIAKDGPKIPLEDAEGEGLEASAGISAAEDLIEAIKAGDAKAVAEAFKALKDC